MKRNNYKHFLTILLSFFVFSAHAQEVSKCAPSPEAVIVVQPDGSNLNVIGKGNIEINYSESTDGYTLVKNKNGAFEYAVSTADGDLLPSGIVANNPQHRKNPEVSFLAKQPTHLRYSAEKIADIQAANGQLFKQKPEEHSHAGESASFPSLGKRKILLILIQYPDMPAKFSKESFVDFMNKENYNNTGSFRDYYLQNSNGKFDPETDVFGWFTAKNNFNYYGNENGYGRSRQLVAEAVDSAKAAGVDFSQYDNDGDGHVDGILVIHAGPGAEEGALNQYIWSHRSSISGNNARTYDGVKIDNYAINPETRGGAAKNMVGIGVFCHEFGHLLGLPDLYDTDESNGKSEGLGQWALMASGNWLNSERTPACFSAFSRIFLQWSSPVVIDADGYYNMRPSVHDTLIYRINTPIGHEYFLLENRQRAGFDSKLPGTGLVIFHVNDSIYNIRRGFNRVNGDVNLKGIDLEEADGKDHLDKATNRGDGGDLYPGVFKVTMFDDETYPSARTYDGKPSGIRIFNIEVLADSSIQFGYGALPLARFTVPKIICQGYPVQFINDSRFADEYAWQFGADGIDDVKNPIFQFNEAGTYYVKLKVKNQAGYESTDSLLLTVHPKPMADFNIEQNGLEVNITNNTLNAKNYYWFWGDGKVSYNSDKNFSRKFQDRGTYVIKLVAIGTGFCNDTLEHTVNLFWETSIEGITKEQIQLKAFPNPVSQNVSIEFILPLQAKISVNLIDALGRTTQLQQPAVMQAGKQQYNFGLAPMQLASGIYMVEVRIAEKPFYFRIVKQ